MLRSLLKAAVLGAAFASVACGGDAFTGGSGDGDGGNTHDSAPPPEDTGPDPDSRTIDAPTIDVVSEPPPSCSGNFACVPAVPAGWQGPTEVYSGTTAPPACTTGFAQSVDAYDGLQAPTPTCGCGCGGSTITCNPPTMAFYDSATCLTVSQACADVFLTPGVCTTVSEASHCVQGATLDISLIPGTSIMGACAAQPSSKVPPYTWTTQARGCVSSVAPAQVNCASGQICAPTAGSGFAAKLCISHTGDVACPGAGYGVKHLYYESAADTRGCSACTCGAASGGSCDFSVTSYSSSNLQCTGNPIIYQEGTKCAGVVQPSDMRLTMIPTNGSCAPSMSAPTGAATAGGPVTVCCPL